jgi:hypothetical protein
MLKPKLLVATAILTLVAVSDAWAQCACVGNLKFGLALSFFRGNTPTLHYVENGELVFIGRWSCPSGIAATLDSDKLVSAANRSKCWADVYRPLGKRGLPTSGWVRYEYLLRCRQCDDYAGRGVTPGSPPPEDGDHPPWDGDTPQSDPPPPK